MKIVWTALALDDLEQLRDYVGRDDPAAARDLVLKILDILETQLPEHPRSGRQGRVEGTRELVIAGTPYILPYRIRAGWIEVLRVYHAKRIWPHML